MLLYRQVAIDRGELQGILKQREEAADSSLRFVVTANGTGQRSLNSTRARALPQPKPSRSNPLPHPLRTAGGRNTVCCERDSAVPLASLQPTAGLGGACVLDGAGHRALGQEQGCYFLDDLPSPFSSLSATSVPSPSGSVPGASAPFRPLFNDFGPPSMGYVQVSCCPHLCCLLQHGLGRAGSLMLFLPLAGHEATRFPGLPEHVH